MNFNVLAINPGSTSTKIALYKNEAKFLSESINHNPEELEKYDTIFDQFKMRKDIIEEVLKKHNVNLNEINAIVGRCGGLPPVQSGAYLINQEMINRLRNNPTLDHASNLGAAISFEMGKELGINTYIYDPVCVDEVIDIARPSGIKEIDRHPLTHALNTRAMAIKYAKQIGKKYEDLNLIVAHLGGGISLNVHEKGRMIDFVSDEEGPFSPERSGKLPTIELINLCYRKKYTYKEMIKLVRGKGGLMSYLETVDAREVEKRINNGDQYAKKIYDAMVLQIAKGIGELSVVLEGKIDAIIVTGGIAYSEYITKNIIKRVKFIAPVEVLAGENELEALAYGGLRVLRGEEKAHIYTE